MVGAITSWDILAHPLSTIRCFGWRLFFRALAPWNGKTFLSLLQEAGYFGVAELKVPTILERCIELEQRAKRIYGILATVFRDQEPVNQFFTELAGQEQLHADMLNICWAASLRAGWNAKLFNPWQEYLPRIEDQMEEAEADAYHIDSVEIALQLVLELESSEINEVFYAALTATDTAFVTHLRPFREATKAHIAYLADRIPQLSPQLAFACRELKRNFPRVRSYAK